MLATVDSVTELLDADEMALWHAWKLAADTVRARIAADIAAAAGLSDADFGVLTRLADHGAMRQNALAESMGWHRSRLSHQVTRMEQRGLLTRHAVANGVELRLTGSGRERAEAARPVHAEAVRRHLVHPLTPSRRRQLRQTLETLTAQR